MRCTDGQLKTEFGQGYSSAVPAGQGLEVEFSRRLSRTTQLLVDEFVIMSNHFYLLLTPVTKYLLQGTTVLKSP